MYCFHSMEHGYVNFWYNCSILSEDACQTLKSGIRTLMESYDKFKIIAFPNQVPEPFAR